MKIASTAWRRQCGYGHRYVRFLGVLIASILIFGLTSMTSPFSGHTFSPKVKGRFVAMVSIGESLDEHEIYLINAEGNATRLTENEAFDGYPTWSPNGQKIAFSSTRDGNWEIYIMDADGGNQTRLTYTPTVDEIFPIWSPNGQQLAVTADKNGGFDFPPGTWADTDIFIMNADGSNPQNITDDDTEDYGAVWSPNGKRLAFSTFRDGNNEIYVMDTDGGNPVNLTNNSASDGFWAPSWSPNGKKIAFSSNRDGEGFSGNEIYAMDADGSNPTRLTNNAAVDAAPIWSTNGQTIAFSSGRDGNREIYVMDVDGSNQMRVTNTSEGEILFDWTQGNASAAVAPERLSSADGPSHPSMARVMR